jgi:MoaA/NifB/PqqE/SkfB family radical SAM enzyme
MPLEITFAPTRFNMNQAEAVIELAFQLGAFRFNTGRLMRLGTAAKLWDRLEPTQPQYEGFFKMLEHAERLYAGRLELCFRPYSVLDALREQVQEPPATLLILPHGKVKVAAALPFLCADVRTQSLSQAWQAYRESWGQLRVRQAVAQVLAEPRHLQEANRWEDLYAAPVLA